MEAFCFTPEEHALIEKKKKACRKHSEFAEWFDIKDTSLKIAIKKHYMLQQNLRCCYCHKPWLSINSIDWDLEHILAESIYDQFFVEPYNLALACKKCNGKKTQKDVLATHVARPPLSYPNQSSDFVVPHPHYDRWDKFLSHLDYKVYIGLDGAGGKGEKLIEVCGLQDEAEIKSGFSPGVIEAAVRSDILAKSKAKIPASITSKLSDDEMVTIYHCNVENHYDSHIEKRLPMLEIIARRRKKRIEKQLKNMRLTQSTP